MNSQIDLSRLSDFFSSDDIEWKPITVSKKTNKGLAAAYVDNRAIMDRLDDVCGPANWRNEYRPGPEGGIICGLSIRVPREDGSFEWVTKWDGAENTDIEAVKGGLSNSMRRAAVQWGIGRYLYRLPQQWVAVDDRGRFLQPPRVPAAFLPTGGSGAEAGPRATEAGPRAAEAPAPPRRGTPRRAESRSEARPQRPAPNGQATRPRNGSAPKPPQVSEDAADYTMPDDLPF